MEEDIRSIIVQKPAGNMTEVCDKRDQGDFTLLIQD